MINRRELLVGFGGAAGLLLLKPYEGLLLAKPRFATDPFTLGVASGDPSPSGVVLWTRLAPDPLNGGGMDPHAVEVRYTIFADEALKKTVRTGTTQAVPELGHSVHVEADGLEPAREYWYRFECGGAQSPVGRTKTAPALDAHPDALAFAFVSCQNWPNGYYAAHRHLAEQDFDLAFHLGDYIYEAKIGEKTARPESADLSAEVKKQPITLEQYRLRYALYKGDKDLQAAHARMPWIVTWDDHEVDNNYADLHDEKGMTPERFALRRAAAYQAYYEHQPLRLPQKPHGPDCAMYRRLSYGDLARFDVLDTRQYRSPQANGDKAGPRDAELTDPNRVLMGKTQLEWFEKGMAESPAKWNVIAQQIVMAQTASVNAKGERVYGKDSWDGYPAERERVLRFLHEAKVANPVVLSGDSHKNWVNDLKLDFDKADSPVVAAEFAGTAISSSGVKPEDAPKWEGRIAENPHIKWFEGVKRGYMSCHLDRKSYRTDVWAVEDVKSRDSKVENAASIVVEDGKPGVTRG